MVGFIESTRFKLKEHEDVFPKISVLPFTSKATAS